MLPHLRLKQTQAKAALRYLEETDSVNKNELRLLVQYENWKDDPEALEKRMEEWNIDTESILGWKEVL